MDRVLIPEIATVPNIKIPAPLSTQDGIMDTIVDNLGKRLINIRMTPATIATNCDAHLVKGINPTFWPLLLPIKGSN